MLAFLFAIFQTLMLSAHPQRIIVSSSLCQNIRYLMGRPSEPPPSPGFAIEL
jgi:hypothetical protein